jgi:aminoglycoside phosphotransferase (APT) family kinase protein
VNENKSSEKPLKALRESSSPYLGEKLEISILSTKGVSHDHWQINNSNMVLRLPKMSQWGMTPKEQLLYEKTAFQRAQASCHCPRLFDTLPISESLPRGGLIVELIEGRPPKLPHDLGAIAKALSAVHFIPLPEQDKFHPLQFHSQPFTSTLSVVEEQASFLYSAKINSKSLKIILDELSWAKNNVNTYNAPNFYCLVGTDTHPGNFLIDKKGKAWFVDLEKMLYGVPHIDLAHATLAVSTGWDPDCSVKLTKEDIGEFYIEYLRLLGSDSANNIIPSLIPLRRLTWLRTITWFARWRSAWQINNHPAIRDPIMTEHIANHIEDSFQIESIRDAQSEWLDGSLSKIIQDL